MLQENIASSNSEIRAISYFATSLYTKETVEEVLWDITKNVIHKLGFVDCVIYQYDDKKNCLLQRAAYGPKNLGSRTIYNLIVINMNEGIVGTVAQNKHPELITDTSIDSRYIVDDVERLSELSVPILINDKLFGVIDTEHHKRNFFTEKHLNLLTIIASLCGQRIKEIQVKNRKPIHRANAYFKKLEGLMQFQKIYMNPQLSLTTTAELLGISACYLSSLVNAASKTSFIDYINQYRIAQVKRNLNSFEYAHYTIVSVGLESGFNSKSAFYNAFKKHTGLTPSVFQQRQLVLS